MVGAACSTQRSSIDRNCAAPPAPATPQPGNASHRSIRFISIVLPPQRHWSLQNSQGDTQCWHNHGLHGPASNTHVWQWFRLQCRQHPCCRVLVRLLLVHNATSHPLDLDDNPPTVVSSAALSTPSSSESMSTSKIWTLATASAIVTTAVAAPVESFISSPASATVSERSVSCHTARASLASFLYLFLLSEEDMFTFLRKKLRCH